MAREYQSGPEQINRERILVGPNADGEYEQVGVVSSKLKVTDPSSTASTDHLALRGWQDDILRELKKITFLLSAMADIEITDEDVDA